VARKFAHPEWTAKGERRACVPFNGLDTLWINTGTLCNITCRNCYIESSPTNDRLAYISLAEAEAFLDEAKALHAREIGFTGGEPFLNPDFPDMLSSALGRGFRVLVLTNAMVPMQRPHIKSRLLAIRRQYADALAIRVSLDHYTKALHETERGEGTWERTLDGLAWLLAEGFKTAIAGRTCWQEGEDKARRGYARLFAERGWALDAHDRESLILFPEMDGRDDVPEITTACWGLLERHPSQMMCATSRMVVKRKGADRPVVVPCTLLPYEPLFEMGATLAEALAADGGMFDHGAVRLCHPHCAKFCVLGGGSCS
jgi:organic radical activating enzyme